MKKILLIISIICFLISSGFLIYFTITGPVSFAIVLLLITGGLSIPIVHDIKRIRNS